MDSTAQAGIRAYRCISILWSDPETTLVSTSLDRRGTGEARSLAVKVPRNYLCWSVWAFHRKHSISTNHLVYRQRTVCELRILVQNQDLII